MTTREECVADAGAVYGSILADPVRGPEIRAARAAASAAAARSAPQSAAGRTPGGVSAGSPTTNPNQQHKQSA